MTTQYSDGSTLTFVEFGDDKANAIKYFNLFEVTK